MFTNLIAKFRKKLNSDVHFAELIKGSGIAFILRIVGIIAGYIFTLLVTKTLGAETWGIFALSLVVLQIASVIGRLGMDTALLRFTAEYTAKGEVGTLKEIYRKALTLVVPFSILVAILVYFLSPILADKVFHKPYLTDYFHIISFIIVPFILLFINSESIRGLKKIKEYMLLQQTGVFIIAVILFLIGLGFIKSHFLPIISYSVSILILAITSIYLWYKYLSHLPSPFAFRHSPSITSIPSTTSNISYKSLLSVSLPMLISSSLALIMGWTDTIMLGIFRSAEEVGIYNVALRLSMVTSMTLMAINTIAAPKFVEFWGKEDIKGLARVAQQSTKLIFWTSFPVLLLFLIFPKHILGIFGEEFKAGAAALMILAVGQFVNSINGSSITLLNLTGHQKKVQNITIISLIINIILNLALIPILGIYGAAISTMISWTIWKVYTSFYVYKYFKIIILPNFTKNRSIEGGI